MSTGHDGFPPTVAVGGSVDVFVNGKRVPRDGDPWATHCNTSCHSGETKASSTVFVNGEPIGMEGDPISCGDTAAIGSQDVGG